MRITQGQFSFLPDLTDEEITMQVQYALDQGWIVAIEHTTDPHPRNAYWDMWGQPMFDLADAAGVMMELGDCRQANPNSYIKILAFDSNKGFESIRMSFLVNRPAEEPGFELVRAEAAGRQLNYTIRSYATAQPAETRYR
ncbi:ribulose bisphosphate carboxylase small subunit [Azospirillum sp. SYSU D00513]|uniref:ribulose bisphosphate carboxylase small subunit n=1 Tax=Azospirillum sp. SYSU D00513 TaxID=2812561 RepID=UPI001A977143|nr:ribulose bisphosphate carboxylase small subunit [Azospirillum sp. SYSU D00513]